VVAVDDDLVAEAPTEPAGAGVKGHVSRLGGLAMWRIRGSCWSVLWESRGLLAARTDHP
jgi:hypothetical protein